MGARTVRVRRAWGALLLAAAGIAALASPAAAQPRRPPNVLLIVVDDLGYGDLASYGAADLRTPHLDSLAAAGIRFEQFYANSPVCSPTRAALLSGRYPDLVGVPGVVRTHARDSWGYLSPDALLLSSLLRRNGYHTAMVGKWHLGLEAPNLPTARGFDHAYVFLGDMMDDYVTHRRFGINYLRRGAEEIDPAGHATDLFTREAVEYLRSRAGSGAPFFLYLAYNAPHVPVQPPADWLRRVRARHPEMDEKRAKLVAFVEHLDDGIGRVLRSLRATGQHQNTLVFFVSDNGGEVGAGGRNGPLRGTKTELYEGGIRVPAIAAWPGHIASGSRSGDPLLTMDIYPTIAETAGIPLDHPIDGRSFLPTLLAQPAPAPERPLFWVRREGGREMGLPIYAVRLGDWKLLQNRPWLPFELYNLREDPAEQTDRAGSEPRVFSQLATLLRAHIQRSGRVPWQEPR